jgi:hypothetical protein
METLTFEKLTMSDNIIQTMKKNTQRDYNRLYSLYYEETSSSARKTKDRVIKCKYGCVDMLFDSKSEHQFHVNRMHLHPLPFLRIMLSHIAWNEVGKMNNVEIATMVGNYLCSLAECKDPKTIKTVIESLTNEVDDLALSTQEVQSSVACSIIAALCKKKKQHVDGDTSDKTATRKRTRTRVVKKKDDNDDESVTNASSIIERMPPSSSMYHLTSGSSDNEDEVDDKDDDKDDDVGLPDDLKPIKMPLASDVCPPLSPATTIASSSSDDDEEKA